MVVERSFGLSHVHAHADPSLIPGTHGPQIMAELLSLTLSLKHLAWLPIIARRSTSPLRTTCVTAQKAICRAFSKLPNHIFSESVSITILNLESEQQYSEVSKFLALHEPNLAPKCVWAPPPPSKPGVTSEHRTESKP